VKHDMSKVRCFLLGILLALCASSAWAQVHVMEEWFNPTTGQLTADIRMVTQAEPRSLWVPAGYRLRFAPSLLSGFQATDSGLNFSGAPVWRTRLRHGRTQPGNAEVGYYADETINRQYLLGLPLQIIEGKRALVAHRADPGKYITGPDVGWTRFYYSASVITTETLYNFQPPAYVEARIRMPNVPGVWPAFWMAASGGTWPPEIDVIESMGAGSADQNAGPSSYWTAHHYRDATGAHRTAGAGWVNTAPETINEFAVYGLHWTATEIVWYFNGREVRRAPNHWPANLQAYLLLNVAVGGTWPGTPPAAAEFPAVMLVDRVRVYTP